MLHNYYEKIVSRIYLKGGEKQSWEDYISRKSILKRIDQLLKVYKQTKNCSKFCDKERKFFNEIKVSYVTDKKLFWKTSKPFFSDMRNYGASIKLAEK